MEEPDDLESIKGLFKRGAVRVYRDKLNQNDKGRLEVI